MLDTARADSVNENDDGGSSSANRGDSDSGGGAGGGVEERRLADVRREGSYVRAGGNGDDDEASRRPVSTSSEARGKKTQEGWQKGLDDRWEEDSHNGSEGERGRERIASSGLNFDREGIAIDAAAAGLVAEPATEYAAEPATGARPERGERLPSFPSERSDRGKRMRRKGGSLLGEASGSSSSSSSSSSSTGGSASASGGGMVGGDGGVGRRVGGDGVGGGDDHGDGDGPGFGYLRSTRELQSDAGDSESTVDMDFEVVLTTDVGDDSDSASSRVALVVEDYADGGRKELAAALGVLPSEVRWGWRVARDAGVVLLGLFHIF